MSPDKDTNHITGIPSPRDRARAVAIDPVCGMTVDPETAAGSYEYEGQTYYLQPTP